jgi:hypothetical protein
MFSSSPDVDRSFLKFNPIYFSGYVMLAKIILIEIVLVYY